MSQTLQHEIRQTKPFASLEAEAFLSIARTAAVLDARLTESLKPHGLTPTQYNVLRILRGAGDAGLCRYEVGDRLVTPGPDVTRLLDRLEAAGLVERTRDPEDRRHVKARITPKGLRLLDQLDAVLLEDHRRRLGHLGEERLRALIDLLASAREGV
ncbi:MAG TPA: MarR family transcriptional regulator [Rubricoccaceae bacterium]|jgi:DNA-binding MarR family transcriptional regulator|nr:MarR family transcriptional regulator [Rubricoccaceae bacterium]